MEATAQVLDAGDQAEFTTNHIARRAGFSIGTLYRYFTDKTSILEKMVEIDLRRQDITARDGLERLNGADAEAIIELAVRTLLKSFRRTRMRRTIMLEMARDPEMISRINSAQMRTIDRFVAQLHRIDPQRFREPGKRLRLMLSGALLGSIRIAVFFDPDTLADPEFERELVALMAHIVTVPDRR